jgi:hypothetical protein
LKELGIILGKGNTDDIYGLESFVEREEASASVGFIHFTLLEDRIVSIYMTKILFTTIAKTIAAAAPFPSFPSCIAIAVIS